jgi:hypothetical protein
VHVTRVYLTRLWPIGRSRTAVAGRCSRTNPSPSTIPTNAFRDPAGPPRTRILGAGRNPGLLEDVKAIAPDRIEVLPAGTGSLPEWARERTAGEGVDVVIDALGAV